MKIFMGSIVLFLLSSPVIISQSNSITSNNEISAAAIWKPSYEIMQKIYSNCGAQQGNKMYDCLLNEMATAGASPNAIEFSGLIKGQGYMDGYKQLGEIGAANVYFVFKRVEHEGLLLVNCTPNLIDVDNVDYLDISGLEQDKDYKVLKNSYPNISIFPGDREGTDYPEKKELTHHGVQIIVNYRLRNGCDDCRLLGFAYFAFDFDSTGKLIGTKLLNVINSLDLQAASAPTGNLNNVFSDPSVPIEVTKGEKFAVVLESNHSAGLKWELGESLDNKLLTLLGTDFVQPYETLPNAAGKETWTFEAIGSGVTTLKFNYVYSWQSEAKPLESYIFRVNVN